MVPGDLRESIAVAPLALTFVAPEGLRQAWKYVRGGLEIVKGRTEAHWLVEDVYTHLRNGSASLLLATRWNKPVGFCILTMTVNPFTVEKVGIIWVAYTFDLTVVNELLPQVEGICKEAGCTHVSFQSPRIGWKRRLAKQGYELREYVFEKRLV